MSAKMQNNEYILNFKLSYLVLEGMALHEEDTGYITLQEKKTNGFCIAF